MVTAAAAVYALLQGAAASKVIGEQIVKTPVLAALQALAVTTGRAMQTRGSALVTMASEVQAVSESVLVGPLRRALAEGSASTVVFVSATPATGWVTSVAPCASSVQRAMLALRAVSRVRRTVASQRPMAASV